MAGESRYTGNPLVTCRVRRGATRQSGKFTEKIWEGPEEAIYGQMGEVVTAADWDSWDLDHEGNKYTLKVRYADAQDEGTTEEQIVNEVRLHANVVHTDVKKLAQFANISREDLQTIDAAIENPKEAESLAAGLTGTALTLYGLYRRGHRSSPVYQPILERRRIAAATFNFSGITSSAFENVGDIIGTSTIDNDAALGGILNFALPSGGQVVDAEGLIYNYGWLKDYPAYDYSAGNKAIVTQQWQFGLWSQDIYGAPI